MNIGAPCSHEHKTLTTVGSSTCDDCGAYVWEHRPEQGSDNPPRSIFGGVLCQFDYQLAKWVPVVSHE